MPSVKRNVKSQEKKTGFEAYDGPEIPQRRAIYRAHLKQLLWKVASTGTMGFRVLVELEADKADPKNHAQYDGYPVWGNLWLGDKEAMVTREGNFYAALGVPDNPAINFDDTDTSKGAKVTSLGGKKLEALMKAVINVDVKPSTDPAYPGFEIDSIYPFKASTARPTFKPSDEEPDEPEDDDSDVTEDEDVAEDEEFDARNDELNALGIVPLRKVAKEHGIATAKLSKDDLIEQILDIEFPVDEAAALEEDEEVEETDDAEEVEEDEEEEAEEDEEEEESEEEDPADVRREELKGFTRAQLKSAIKKAQPEFKIFARHTDEELVDALVDIEFGDETPF